MKGTFILRLHWGYFICSIRTPHLGDTLMGPSSNYHILEHVDTSSLSVSEDKSSIETTGVSDFRYPTMLWFFLNLPSSISLGSKGLSPPRRFILGSKLHRGSIEKYDSYVGHSHLCVPLLISLDTLVTLETCVPPYWLIFHLSTILCFPGTPKFLIKTPGISTCSLTSLSY